MRSLILTAALGLGAMAFLAATPSEAKAYWPVNPYVYRLNNYGYGGAYIGSPYYRYQAGPYGAAFVFGYPGAYRTYVTPFGYGVNYMSPSAQASVYSSLYGYYNVYSTPGYMSYSYSPYFGYRRFVAPGVNYAVPAGYSAGYVPYGFGY